MMLDNSEYSGVWWLPENPETKIHGKLTYDTTKRPVLKLNGAFNENPPEYEFYDIILGDSFGERITLKNCGRRRIETIRRQDLKEYRKSEFVVSTFFVGHHFLKKEDIRFTRLSARYFQLEEWLGETIFHLEPEKNEEEKLLKYVLKISIPRTKEIALEEFTISIDYGFSHRVPSYRKPELESNASVSINVSEETSIDELFPLLYHFKNFLNLATGNRVTILSLNGINKNFDEFKSIKIFYREEISPEQTFYRPFFPFNYKSISKRLDFYLQNWFNLVERIKPTYELYFGTVYNPQLYLTLIFLNFAQAIESYHSRTHDKGVISDATFKDLHSLISRIIKDKIPKPDVRQHFYSIAGHMNRKALRKRIEELFQEYGNLFAVFINNKDAFIKKVVDSRNYYTHYSKDLEKKAAKLLELPYLSDRLRFMLFVILLKEVGFNDEITEHALRNYMRFTTTRSIH